MQIKRFDKPTARQFAATVVKALAGVEQEYGVKFTYRGGKLDDLSFTMKLESKIIPKNADGKVVSPEEAQKIDFVRNAPLVGLTAADYRRKFTIAGRTFTIVGVKPRNYALPVIAESARGTKYKFRIDQVSVKAAVKSILQQGKRSEAEILADFRRVEGQLSPENLHADGERPMAAVRALASQLNAQKAKLIAELGREPTFNEIYNIR